MTTTTPDAVTPDSAPGERAWVLERPSFGYKPALDGLRAVAVMSVVAYHFGAGWLQGGFLGVDMFFVLSGYLITSLLLIEWSGTGTIHFGGFWARRARRLLPALFLVLVVVALWGRIVLDSDQWHQLRWDGVWSLFYAANWRFVVAGTSYFSAEPSMLRHMWSLAIEEQFYLVWPLVVFGALWLGKGRHALLTGVCVVGTAASVAIMQWKYEPGRDPSRVYYGTDARASQLLIGALLAILLVHWMPRARASRAAVQIVGTLAAFVVLFLFWSARDQHDFLYRGGFILFAVAVTAVIAAIVQPVTTNPMKALMCVPPIRWIGQVSYGVYLWHWPVFVALSRSRLQGWGWNISGWRLSIVQLAVTFGIAALSYYLVELPIRHRKYRNKAWASALVLSGFALTLGVIVATTVGATTDPLTRAPGTVLGNNPNVPVATTLPGSPVLPTSRVLLLGDSVAFTLGDALTQAGAVDGVTSRTVGRLGCGMTTGIALADGKPLAWSPDCAAGAVDYLQGALDEFRPDTLMWLSTWETSDFEVGGTVVQAGTPEWRRWLLGEMERVRATAAADGARLALVTNPPTAPNASRDLVASDLKKLAQLNDVMREFVATHPDTVLVDVASIVCPEGGTVAAPCPTTQDGIVLRPKDGGHYDADGAAWLAPRMLDALYAALEARPLTTTTTAPGTATTTAR